MLSWLPESSSGAARHLDGAGACERMKCMVAEEALKEKGAGWQGILLTEDSVLMVHRAERCLRKLCTIQAQPPG